MQLLVGWFPSRLAPGLCILLLLFPPKAVLCFANGGLPSPFRLAISLAAPPQSGRARPLHRSTSRGRALFAISTPTTDANDDATTVDGAASSDVPGAGITAVEDPPRIWPCMDALDKRLILIALPVIANFAIGPLIGAVDLFWVNRMGNALAVAGQAAANQVFNSVFWLTSFLPSITATLISKENAKGNQEGVQDAVCQALFVGIFLALVSSVVLLMSPDKVLGSVLPAGAPALLYAKPYFLIRSFAFVPALISLVGFSAFRGVLDTMTPVKISLFANVFNAVLDPILIFSFGMGVPGGTSITLFTTQLHQVAQKCSCRLP